MSPSSQAKPLMPIAYLPLPFQVAILRLLKQLSEVYSTLKISSLSAMVPFATFAEIEAVIVDAVRYDYLQVRVDHRNGTLHFGGQQLESDKVKSHLAVLASRLSKAIGMIDPRAASAEDRSTQRMAVIKAALEKSKEEHKLMIARKVGGLSSILERCCLKGSMPLHVKVIDTLLVVGCLVDLWYCSIIVSLLSPPSPLCYLDHD